MKNTGHPTFSYDLFKHLHDSGDALKNIVKECLVEILQEGISGDMLIKESSSSRKMSGLAKAPQRIRPGDAMHPGLDNVRFTKKVDEAASGLTDDPIMSSKVIQKK